MEAFDFQGKVLALGKPGRSKAETMALLAVVGKMALDGGALLYAKPRFEPQVDCNLCEGKGLFAPSGAKEWEPCKCLLTIIGNTKSLSTGSW